MDIFKLGDKILDLLNVIFAFWNNQVSLVFALLGQSPTAFKDGKPWEVIEGLEPVFVAVGSSLVVLFFVIGFCSESIDIREEMRFEVILRILIRLGLAEYLVANNVTIMKAFFQSVGALVGLIAEGGQNRAEGCHRAGRCDQEPWFWRKSDHADLSITVIHHCDHLRLLFDLHGIFPLLKAACDRASWLYRIFNDERKPGGGTYLCDILQVFSVGMF